MYGHRPFGQGISQNKVIKQKIIEKARSVEFPDQTPRKTRVSNEAKEFISECLIRDPE